MSYTGKKVWFVTGSSSGLGRAMVVYLLEQGDRVVATLRKPDDISDLALKYSSEQLLVIKLDVTSPAQVKAAFSTAIEKFGRVDVVYNNAGIGSFGEIEGTPNDIARNVFDVNFWGSTSVALEAVHVFRDVNQPRGGRLLQVSSVVGISPAPVLGYYSASKFAIEGIIQALSNELDSAWDIKLTLLELGGFRTRAVDPQSESMLIVPAHPAYSDSNSTTSAIRQFFATGGAHNGGSDTAKVSREIYKVALDNDVGLRVPFGIDAIEGILGQLDAVKKDVEAARTRSADLGFDVVA